MQRITLRFMLAASCDATLSASSMLYAIEVRLVMAIPERSSGEPS
ncbi:MAG: hypothetical protein OET63_07950 [Desulfobacterales bacterium]|nr:hypothetical protein [Desulfobacterales bacterium]